MHEGRTLASIADSLLLLLLLRPGTAAFLSSADR